MKIFLQVARAFYAVAVFLFIGNNCFAYKENTHFKLNQFIAKNNIGGFSLNDYIQNYLGFDTIENQILRQWENQVIHDKVPTIDNWLGFGGEQEDLPFNRLFRHFHNPLEPWDDSGLWGGFDSSIVWSQRAYQYPGGQYSWKDVRSYFYTALTAVTQTERGYFFSEMFRGIGQQMHIVQDASVPLHTRDDAHVFDRYNYEFYVENICMNDLDTFKRWMNLSTAYMLNEEILNLPQNSLAPIAIARLIDADQYDGTNPEITVSETQSIGIAEYSNANFLSTGTIPGSTFSGSFPYPILENYLFGGSCKLQYVEITDPRDNTKTIQRPYWIKAAHGDTGYRLATFPTMSSDKYGLVEIFPSLDDNVYEDYAQRLIPCSVSYSSGLLEYFFRGTIEISDFEVLVDYPLGHHPTPVGFNKVTVYAKNSSPEGETMDAGTVHLVVKYKVDEKDGYLNMPYRPSDYQYITAPLIDDNEEIISDMDVPPDEIRQFDFDLSDKPIPLCAKEIYFFLVYRGQLGRETDGIGVGYTPFTEFRTVEVGLSNEGLYALSDLEPTDVDPTTEGFDSLKCSAKNIDPDGHSAPSGTICVIIKYRAASQNQFQNPPPDSWEGFHYIVKDVPAQSIPIVPSEASDPVQFALDLSYTPIPLWATDIYLYLVYSGHIGDKACMTAVGFKDISEPTPIAYYNCMDKICLYGDMVDAGDEALTVAISHGMQSQWDVYPHDRNNVYIRYSSVGNPQQLAPGSFYNYKIPSQAAGEFTTLHILTDYDFALNDSQGEIIPTDSRDTFDHYGGNYVGPILPATAIKNQIVPAPLDSPYYNPNQTVYIRHIPVFTPFRDIENKWLSISLGNRPLPENYPDNINCHY